LERLPGIQAHIYDSDSKYRRLNIRQYCSCTGTSVIYLCTRSWL